MILSSLLAITSSLNPGDIIKTVYFNTSTCPHPTPANTDGVCFSAFGHHPASFCRVQDTNCTLTGQRVVSSLAFQHYGACTVYAWTWTCAYNQRKKCGNWWCDSRANCVDGQYCECPNNMIGDAAWHSCGCPPNQHANDSNICVDLPACVLVWNDDEYSDPDLVEGTVAPSQPTRPNQVQDSEAEPELAIGIMIVLITIACILGTLLGFWCGHHYIDSSQVAPVSSHIARQHKNQMYISAPSPVYYPQSSTSRLEDPLPDPPQRAWAS